jgi:hypothetical protein
MINSTNAKEQCESTFLKNAPPITGRGYFERSEASPAVPFDETRIKVEFSVEHRWSDPGTGKAKYWEKNKSQCHSVHHKSHVDRSEIEPGTPK